MSHHVAAFETGTRRVIQTTLAQVQGITLKFIGVCEEAPYLQSHARIVDSDRRAVIPLPTIMKCWISRDKKDHAFATNTHSTLVIADRYYIFWLDSFAAAAAHYLNPPRGEYFSFRS
jgi:hypothetical protein